MTPKSILVIEDDESLRSMIEYLLEAEGYVVKTAENGKIALDLLKTWEPQLILLDMRMPVMDGWEFSKRYKETHEHRAPVIILTASEEVAIKNQELQANDILGKPFNIANLMATIEKHIR